MILNFFLRNKNIGFLLLSSVFYFSINAFLNKYIAENFGTNGLLEFNYAFNLFIILFTVACFGSETALARQSIFFETKNIDGFKELYSAISFFGILISIPIIIFFLIYYFQESFEMIIASSVVIISAFFIQFIRIQFLRKQLGYVLQIIQSLILLILFVAILLFENPSIDTFYIFLIFAYFLIYFLILLLFYFFKPFDFKNIPLPYPKNLRNSEQINNIKTVIKIASMTLISTIFFNFSEIFLRDISISNGYSENIANVEAYLRITSWWVGMGLALISLYYLPLFTKRISEEKLMSNFYALKKVFPIFFVLSIFGCVFSFIFFNFTFGKIFKIDLIVLLFFVASGLCKLIGISFLTLHQIELRFKIYVAGQFIMNCLIVMIFYFLFIFNVVFTVNLFSGIYLFTNFLFMVFAISSRAFTKKYQFNSD
tara:strand:+ start:952 stop:2232 length:1281 start_codon:yes stop_codon:yes gene_type:complete